MVKTIRRSSRRIWRRVSNTHTKKVAVPVLLLATVLASVFAANIIVSDSNADQFPPGIPAAPTIDDILLEESTFDVDFTAGDPGGGTITNYQYSTDNGVTWRDRDDSGGATSPIVVSLTSEGDPLDSAVIYQVRIRAVSEIGQGLSSNMVEAELDSEGLYAFGWGEDEGGQLGDGESDFEGTPNEVETEGTPMEGEEVEEVSAGSACAIANGQAFCWGPGENGRLGNNSTEDTAVPVAVTTTGTPMANKTVTAISSRGGTACAVADGEAFCWGSNSNGQLGNNSTTQSLVPVAVTTAGTPLANKTVTDVSVGATHTCAVADGEAFCWGSNSDGQLGNNSTTQSLVPVAVTTAGTPIGEKDVILISAATTHTCAVAKPEISINVIRGQVVCWGDNEFGQLGDDSTTRRLVPVAVAEGEGTAMEDKDATFVSAGATHTCAVADGEAFCWGDNEFGQLGDDSRTPSEVPVAVAASGTTMGEGGVTVISAGLTHTCAAADGEAFCWGDNEFGQLGDDSRTPSEVPVAVQDGGTLMANDVVTSIAAGGTNGGGSYTCAVADGEAFCWGQNLDGRLGNGVMNRGRKTTPVPTATATTEIASGTFQQVSAGHNHACAIANGQAFCWGDNKFGQLGNDTTTSSILPVAVTTAETPMDGKLVTSISAGMFYTCAVADGEAFCWGDNEFGQMGDGTFEGSLVPVAVETGGSSALSGKTVTGVAAGGSLFVDGEFELVIPSHTCAVAEDEVVCWGDNEFGQLGDGTETSSNIPVQVTTTNTPMENAVATGISVGADHTCAVADESIFCWGNNTFGQLGDGTTADANTPVFIGVPGVEKVTAGFMHTCAVADGEAFCWGENSAGQLGDGTNTGTSSPTPVDTSGVLDEKEVFDVSAGEYHTCVTAGNQSETEFFCWGFNQSGQLGNNSTQNSNVPVAVTTTGTLLEGSVAVEISAGGNFTASLAKTPTPLVNPSAPVISSVTPTGRNLFVNFTPPASTGGAPINGYQYSTDGGTTWINVRGGPNQRSPLVIGFLSSNASDRLTNGQSYNVVLRALNAFAEGTPSNTVTSTPDPTGPSAPRIMPPITSKFISSNPPTLEVTFIPPGNTGGDRITDYQYSTDNGTTWKTAATTSATGPNSSFGPGGSLRGRMRDAVKLTVTDLSVNTNKLAFGQTYQVRVRAVNSAGSGEPSIPENGTTVPGPPAAPTGVPGDSIVSLSWGAPNPNNATITDYKIQRSTNNGATWVDITRAASPATSAVVSGLANATAYRFRVAAVNASGQGPWSANSAQITPRTTPDAPTITSVLAYSDQVAVNFNPPVFNGGATITNYQYSTNNGSNWTTVSPASTTSPIIIPNLTLGTTYQVRIRAGNAAGFGTASNMVSSTTSCPTGSPVAIGGDVSIISENGKCYAVHTFDTPGLTWTMYNISGVPINGNTTAHPANANEFDQLIQGATQTATGAAEITDQASTNTINVLNWVNATELASATGTTIPNNGDNFAFVVTGSFVPQETGTYTFTISGDDAVDIMVGNTIVASRYGGGGTDALGTNNGTISLVAGTTYPLRIRQEERTGGEGLRVFWKKPSQSAGSGWFQDPREMPAAEEFEALRSLDTEYLVVGGGGAGGTGSGGFHGGGGGGGGGVLSGTTAITAQPYTVMVGGGGSGRNDAANTNDPGENGGNSSVFGLTAVGGGGGGSTTGNGANGGSGGGASGRAQSLGTSAAGTAVAGQGNDGGAVPGSGNRAGGGGGGGAGGAGNSPVAGTGDVYALPQGFGAAGGAGVSSDISGVTSFYGGGGGGGNNAAASTSDPAGGGGSGGGGAGGRHNANSAQSGTANTGGGGGGSGTGVRISGAGGSGVVIIKYEIKEWCPSTTSLASGGSISIIGRDGECLAVHTFDQVGTSTFTANESLQAEYLVVAGGGGGGGVIGGGGGGGGMVTGNAVLPGANYPIVVGNGGLGGSGWNTASQDGKPGQNTTAFNITALGGGGGRHHGGNTTSTVIDGGSGGGGAEGGATGGTGLQPGSTWGGLGNNGGGGGDSNRGAGGGGTGTAGGNTVTGGGGNGGAGATSSITGQTVSYAGGGGGGLRSNQANQPGAGGSGGGGAGSKTSTKATDGTPGTGGGGGGAGYDINSTSLLGGNGGSGIVIVRYSLGEQGLPEGPGRISDLEAKPANSNTAVLTFTQPRSGGNPILDYTVQRATNDAFTQNETTTNNLQATCDDNNQCFIEMTGITNVTDFRFRVKARNEIGLAPAWSNIGRVGLVPLPPTNVAGVAGNQQISLSWTAPTFTGGSAINFYNIRYSTDDGETWEEVLPVAGTSTSTVITGLPASLSYVFEVTASNATATSLPGVSSSIPLNPVAPSVPTSVTSSTGATTSTINWAVPSNNGGSPITGYEVRIGSGAWVSKTASQFTHTFTGLLTNTSYTTQVRAINAAGVSTAVSQTRTTLDAVSISGFAPSNVTIGGVPHKLWQITGPGTITLRVGTVTNARVVIIAGGASGGLTSSNQSFGGGGGAGGVRDFTINMSGNRTVTRGAGGGARTSNGRGNAGGNSSVSGTGLGTATGGGGGGGATNSNGGNGGSGGGGVGFRSTVNLAGGSGTSGQGNNGGAGSNITEIGCPLCIFFRAGGGGGGRGGAGQAGGNTTNTTVGGAGGACTDYGAYWGESTGGTRRYAAGGGGATANNKNNVGGCSGRGGRGARFTFSGGRQNHVAAVRAATNSWGSGGGGAYNGPSVRFRIGAAGTNGVILLRYASQQNAS